MFESGISSSFPQVSANTHACALQDAFDLYHKAMQTFRSIMDSDDSADWLDSSAIVVVKSFALLAKQGHIAASKSPEGSKVLRDACEEIRRLVNSSVRHDRVRDLKATTFCVTKGCMHCYP